MKKIFFAFAATALASLSALAIDPGQAPTINIVSTPGNAIINRISDNGAWAVGTNYTADDEEFSSPGIIYNLKTNKYEAIPVPYGTEASWISDVTNDGKIIVGSLESMPAYYDLTAAKWVELPIPNGYASGGIVAVTPDGKYAVGTNNISEFEEQGCLWDLTTGKIVDTPFLPQKDMTNQWQGQNRFLDISPDGRYILGCISYSYIMPAACACYVYDRNNSTSKFIGFQPNYTGTWTPKVKGLYFIGAASMSANGKYVTGEAYMVKDGDDNEYPTTFVYDVLADEITVYDNANDEGIISFAIDGNGVAYGCAPNNTPIRDWYVRHGKYWYPFSDIMSQIYGKDVTTIIASENTGTVNTVSSDGKQFGIFTDPRGEGYVMSVGTSLYDLCPEVDLLANYTFTPSAGASFSTITSITVKFDRAVDLIGDAKGAKLVKADGTLVRNSMGISINGSTVIVTFRPTELEVGQKYKVIIPAGIFSLSGDAEIKNREMSVEYVGRDQSPMHVTEVFPAEGTALPRFDYSTSQIMMVFNTDINFTGEGAAYLYMDGEETPMTQLYMAAYGNQLLLYPATTQYLYKGSTYHVTLIAGSIVDAGNAGPNEEFTVSYVGTYEREVSHDDKYLFQDDFQNGINGFMYYEGDHNEPNEEMQGFGFSADSTPWFYGSNDYNYSNIFMMSHSCYEPQGTSNDWMMIPQLYIPDEVCRLTFDAQSFRKTRADRLSVYVIPCETVYNYLSDAIMEKLLPNAVKVFDQQLTPGASEDATDGDWTPYEVSLAQFAGKAVYIAFVNENTQQSIVFLDNVKVIHDVSFLAGINTPETVVNKSSVAVSGYVAIESEVTVFKTAKFELLKADGTVVSTSSADNLNLKYGDTYSFSFPKELPLTVGEINNYSVRITLDGETLTLNRSVKNMSFATNRRVVLEEYSGTSCGNCPRGFLAVENINKLFPGKLIPVVLRTFDGDRLTSGMGGYTSALGFSEAPMGIIDRKTMCGPMAQLSTGAVSFSGEGTESTTWLDAFMEELNVTPEADIEVQPSVDGSTLNVDCEVKFAVSNSNANVGVFTVVLEDKLATSQENYLYNVAEPLYGEWGQGGIYSVKTVRNYQIDHVARGLFAASINGTIGLVPNSVKAGETYKVNINGDVPSYVSNIDNVSVCVMLIDVNTNSVINANLTYINPAGIENVSADNSDITIGVVDGQLVANSIGTEVRIDVYNAMGALVASASGDETAKIDASLLKGVNIVRACTTSAVKTAKIIIK